MCWDIRVLVLLSDYVPTLWVWLGKYKMRIAADVISTLVIDEHIPTRVMLLVNDFMAYRFKITVTPRM